MLKMAPTSPPSLTLKPVASPAVAEKAQDRHPESRLVRAIKAKRVKPNEKAFAVNPQHA